MDPTPVSLILRLRKPGDTTAWQRFVELFAPLLRGWARRLGFDGADADDLVQDVFVTLLRQMPVFEYDPSRSFRAWLWTVLYRAGRRQRQHQPAALPDDGAEVAAPPEPAPGETEYRTALVGRALRVMQADFAPETWQACWALAAEGRPAAEVARELEISVNAVYLARSRVLARLRRELAGLLD